MAVGRDNYQVNFVLPKDFLEVSLVRCVSSGTFLLSRPHEWRLTIRSRSRFSRWNDVQEIFVCYELSILVNHSNGGLKVSAVQRIDDGTHDVQPLPLGDEVFLDSSSSLSVLLIELSLLVLDFKVASVHQLLVPLTAATRDMSLGVLFQLDLDLVKDAREE